LYRLQSRAQFEAVLGSPVVAKTPNFALHLRSEPTNASPQTPAHSPDLFEPQAASLGAMVPKRWARKAVTRNLVKRQIYAVAQEHLPDQPPHAYVVRLRQAFAAQKFRSAASGALKQEVRSQLLTLLNRPLGSQVP
jgi:ribonuclease P protein component